jgi:Caspase domain
LRDTYNYIVKKASINNEKRAQAQIQKHLADFIFEHDSIGVLLIIYYAGHGWAPRGSPKEFYLLGYRYFPFHRLFILTGGSKTDQQAQKENERNRVAWVTAESLLENTEADVLVIFDCCQAGQLCTYRAPVRFEYLGACAAHQNTPAPGEASFTSALIWALGELRTKDSFPVSELHQKIKQAPRFPKMQDPALAHRFYPSPDHIVLAPMNPSVLSVDDMKSQSESFNYRPKEFLDLRLHFPVPLSDEVIIQTAKALSLLITDQRMQADCVSFIRKHTQPNPPELLQITSLLMERNKLVKRAEEYARLWMAKGLKRRPPPGDIDATYPTSESRGLLERSLPFPPQNVESDQFNADGSHREADDYTESHHIRTVSPTDLGKRKCSMSDLRDIKHDKKSRS